MLVSPGLLVIPARTRDQTYQTHTQKTEGGGFRDRSRTFQFQTPSVQAANITACAIRYKKCPRSKSIFTIEYREWIRTDRGMSHIERTRVGCGCWSCGTNVKRGVIIQYGPDEVIWGTLTCEDPAFRKCRKNR